MVTERRRQTRYSPDTNFTVYDRSTDKPIGGLANISATGAMFVTSGPIRQSTVMQCRIELANPIMGHESFLFDVECQWSRKDIKSGQWESGYRLKVTGKDIALLQYLMLSFRLQGRGAEEIPDVKTVDMVSRRESVRHDFDKALPVFEQRSYRQIGELLDLSTQGMRLATPGPIRKGGSLSCRVKLPQEVFQHDYLIFETECMWSASTGNGTAHVSGHKIVKIESPHEAILLYLLIHYGKPQTAKRQERVVG